MRILLLKMLPVRQLLLAVFEMVSFFSFCKQQAVIGGLAASLATGYASYKISKKIKEKMDQ
jgi:hypothetical protein